MNNNYISNAPEDIIKLVEENILREKRLKDTRHDQNLHSLIASIASEREVSKSLEENVRNVQKLLEIEQAKTIHLSESEREIKFKLASTLEESKLLRQASHTLADVVNKKEETVVSLSKRVFALEKENNDVSQQVSFCN